MNILLFTKNIFQKFVNYNKIKQKKAIEQELVVARKLGAHLIIATDTQKGVWVNVQSGNRVKDETGNEIKIKFDPKDEKLPKLIEKIIIIFGFCKLFPKNNLWNSTQLIKNCSTFFRKIANKRLKNCLTS